MENEKLEALMDAASMGGAVEEFLREFLKAELFVPSRFQEQPMSDAPEYPNPFFNLLGIHTASFDVIPVFTDPEYLEDWSGMPLVVEKITGAKLVEKVPEEWWITVNTGQDVEKEFSPWEIDLLRGGEIAAIVEEIKESLTESTTFVTTEDDEEVEVKQLLVKTAKELPEVKRMYLVKCIPVEEEKKYNLMLGVECEGERSDTLQDKIKNAVALQMIGRDPLQIYINDDNSLMFGMFRQLVPFYVKATK